MQKSLSLILCLTAALLASCSLPGNLPERAPELVVYQPPMIDYSNVPVARVVLEPSEQPSKVKPVEREPVVAEIDDIARLLAGMPARPGRKGALEGWRRTVWWAGHRRAMDALYIDFYEDRGMVMEDWRAREMGDLSQMGNLFYPFSGPDFLFANSLFPGAHHHLMVGLEAPERLPDLRQMTNSEFASGLDGLRRSLGTVLDYSFFITKDMRRDFTETKFKGVLPPLLVFMARSGHQIDSVQDIGLLPDGTLAKRTVSWSSHPAPGLLLKVRDGSGMRKDVVYLREDLSDATLSHDKRLLNYAAARVPAVTFFKSASYLCHEGGFSTIRRFARDFSSAVVQDASGLPFRDFSSHEWDLRLYGNYTKTLDIFSEHYQQDLRDAFAQRLYPVGKMEFGLGYEYNWDVTAVIVARRKGGGGLF